MIDVLYITNYTSFIFYFFNRTKHVSEKVVKFNVKPQNIVFMQPTCKKSSFFIAV